MKGSNGSVLAGAHPADSPGLPRGRSKRPRDEARNAQIRRLFRATIAAVAENTYAATSVTDIVTRARVSRREFYEYFADKEQCFLAAALDGGFLLNTTLVGAMESAEAGDGLRAIIHSHLQLCINEPEFARCLLFEILAAGAPGWQLRAAAFEHVGNLLCTVSARPGVTLLADDMSRRRRRSLAAVGAVAEMTASYVGSGRTDRLLELEDDIVDIVDRIFNG